MIFWYLYTREGYAIIFVIEAKKVVDVNLVNKTGELRGDPRDLRFEPARKWRDDDKAMQWPVAGSDDPEYREPANRDAHR